MLFLCSSELYLLISPSRRFPAMCPPSPLLGRSGSAFGTLPRLSALKSQGQKCHLCVPTSGAPKSVSGERGYEWVAVKLGLCSQNHPQNAAAPSLAKLTPRPRQIHLHPSPSAAFGSFSKLTKMVISCFKGGLLVQNRLVAFSVVLSERSCFLGVCVTTRAPWPLGI